MFLGRSDFFGLPFFCALLTGRQYPPGAPDRGAVDEDSKKITISFLAIFAVRLFGQSFYLSRCRVFLKIDFSQKIFFSPFFVNNFITSFCHTALIVMDERNLK